MSLSDRVGSSHPFAEHLVADCRCRGVSPLDAVPSLAFTVARVRSHAGVHLDQRFVVRRGLARRQAHREVVRRLGCRSHRAGGHQHHGLPLPCCRRRRDGTLVGHRCGRHRRRHGCRYGRRLGRRRHGCDHDSRRVPGRGRRRGTGTRVGARAGRRGTSPGGGAGRLGRRPGAGEPVDDERGSR